jgi:hypothetical protein
MTPPVDNDPAADLPLPPEPVLSMTEDEAREIRIAYRTARVILEYGSGGSTMVASRLPGKLVFSVESDPNWARQVQLAIDARNLPSPAILYPVDIGPVGLWGRPVDTRDWKKFYDYPSRIWSEPFFRHPDVVLIDGRFRAACLAVTLSRITRPVTVLFDDYARRPAYHVVEDLVGRPRKAGRMAVFEVDPARALRQVDGDMMMRLMRQASYVGNTSYRKL